MQKKKRDRSKIKGKRKRKRARAMIRAIEHAKTLEHSASAYSRHSALAEIVKCANATLGIRSTEPAHIVKMNKEIEAKLKWFDLPFIIQVQGGNGSLYYKILDTGYLDRDDDLVPVLAI